MKKYWAIFKTQLLSNFTYPVDLLARSLTIIIFLFIFKQLWQATYRSVGEERIAGLTLSNTLWYLMLAETILLSKPRLLRTISQSIKDGSIAYLINKPFNYLLYQLSLGLGDAVVVSLFNVIIGGAATWLMVGPPPPPFGWPMVLVGVVFAWLLDFCISTLIALAAFVTEDVTAFEWIYTKVLFIIGGLLIPIDLYPAWLQTITHYLPFSYILYQPSRLFVEPDLGRFGNLVGGQLIWLLILGLLVSIIYQRGTRLLTINGG